MLIDEIKKANLIALKNKDKDARGVISVVLSRYQLLDVEAKSKGKELSDSDLLSIIQKVLKELKDEQEGYAKVNNHDRVSSIARQMEVIYYYLPKQLSEEEIKEEISKLADKSVPAIMKHFKENFAGKVNMSLVNTIARSI